jgi:Dyp-type peroxidase family
MADTLELDDVQGLIVHGFAELKGAVFLRLRVEAAAPARRWLAALKPRITRGNEEKPERVVNVAFSASGLRKLGLDAEILAGFAKPFREGLLTEQRRRLLGDVGGNAPENWEWGGSEEGEEAAHALLLVYAKDSNAARKVVGELEGLEGWEGWHGKVLPEPCLLKPAGEELFREHFGFVDGIANPSVRGFPETTRSEGAIAPGEILLGYPNETGRLPPSPRVPPGGGSSSVLPNGDLGRNGSYLVVRQLAQDPALFWRHLLAQEEYDEEQAIHLAARMVGRWPNGAPLTKWPMRPPQGSRHADNDFLFGDDTAGHRCPLGAHIRRSHPRDAVPALDAPKSIELSRRRRLLRRGRPYGATVAGWPDHPKAMSDAHDDDSRGLHFLCFNADLENQFEFVQQTWVNSRKFAGLRNDADPLLSNPECPFGAGPNEFTMQGPSGPRRVSGLPQFVRVRGGAYLFAPGGRALDYIASSAP